MPSFESPGGKKKKGAESPKAPEQLREYGPEVAVLRAEMQKFRESHDFDALHAITKVELPPGVPMTPSTLVDAIRAHPVREPARLALNLIQKALSKIEKETDIPDDVYKALYIEEYNPLSSAVGIVEPDGRIVHDRKILEVSRTVWWRYR